MIQPLVLRIGMCLHNMWQDDVADIIFVADNVVPHYYHSDIVPLFMQPDV